MTGYEEVVHHREPDYSEAQRSLIARLEADLAIQLERKKHRLAHSLSVASCAEGLALAYGADPFEARLAGTLHDWDKALTSEQVLARARELGVDMGVDPVLVVPLLHGIVAARDLPVRYPEVPSEVWHAIEVHTTAAPEMSPLDMVLFVADGIEPLRQKSPGIEETRALVGKVALPDLFWDSFVGGIIYVLKGSRYLWPGTIDTYNKLAAARAGSGA
ncbi:bis(5'-nucleosyl)-tetraphosphatase (symmetrical) YqeK [Olsenella sp. Marseille-P4559]|uniref:bis(5'-nucleosyl)-tetraphosphatase (symmetrical) YqeK n=1 Tax=Olsenella sp. Marseille-P4559 TaxID=2364795 RepID=UPI00102F4611|nr:bis(5'-nucleosyl)-tetraphosphatase (symmetrical) YqeK [Olsenella sp. Marseille-P4559]